MTNGVEAVLRQIDDWPVPHVAVVVTGPVGVLAERGDINRVFRLASITKLLVAYACLIAHEEGVLDLDGPAGPAGSTVRHLLAHASGLGFDDAVPPSPVGRRRSYSNPGFERLGELLATATAMPVADYVREGILDPLEMTSTELRGSPAHGARGSAADLARFARELLRPTLVSADLLAEAVHVQFPGLSGVQPGLGRLDPLDWGLGFDLRSTKHPSWMGESAGAATFGHFGGSGTFLWVDPVLDRAAVALADREFDEWALAAWIPLNDALLAALRERAPSETPPEAPHVRQ
jgi:CubicO group peptidase (beta-lactamase class C family)